MTLRNMSLKIDLDRLLVITGYRVRFRAHEWVECLLLGPQESFIGRGEDENEALMNALLSALPTRLAQKLLERLLAEQVTDCDAPAPAEPSPGPGDASAGEELSADVAIALRADEDSAPVSDPAPRPLSQEEVRAYLKERVRTVRTVPSVGADPGQLLRSLLDRAREPSPLATDLELIDELDVLDGISSPEQAERWLVLPADIQRLWLGYLVARMRAVKDKTSASLPDLRARVGTVIKRFPTFSARTRPGHVNGLMVSHKPASGTWSGDARNLLQELRAIAWPAKVASAEPRKEPRREVDRADPRDDEPLDWDHRETVASMRIVMFGGSPREEARANLERALGIGSLEWPEGDRPRRVEALTQRIVAGTVDLLLIVRSYVQHKDANKLIDAARVRGTPFALVDAGYGIEAVKAAIGEAMARRSQAS